MLAETYFEAQVFVGFLDILYVRWRKNLSLVGQLVMVTRTWRSEFIISKFLH